MPRLAVTRTSSQLNDLKARGAARGIEVLPLPLISVRNLAFEWPDNHPVDSVTWVFFTSANGVTAFLQRLDSLHLRLPPATKFAAVGSKTAQALEQNGLRVSYVPSDSYGQMLFEEFAESVMRPGDVLVYARGKEVNYDPKPLFAGRQVAYLPVVCYETIPQPLSVDAIRCLSAEDYILFTAPSTVDAYFQQFGKPVAKPIAIGRSTAAQMNQYGWFGFITMKHADITTILEYL